MHTDVLLIENNQADTLGYSTWIAHQGPDFSLQTTATMDDAIEVLGKKRFDLVLLDLDLSKVPHLEDVLAVLNTSFKPAVLVLTQAADEQLAAQILQCGAQDYLVKSTLTDENLIRAMRHSLARKTQRRCIDELNGRLREANSTLLRRDQTRRNLIAYESHELRNPLAAIRSAIDVVRRAGPLNTAQDEFSRSALRNVQRLDDMIRRMLEQASLEADRVTMNLQTLEVGEAVATAIQGLRGAALERNIRVTFSKPPLPITILADNAKVEKIFSNLMGNAIKYSPAGSEITITTEERSSEGRFVEINITDQGAGIAPENIDSIFAPFTRSESSQRAVPGSGLGLAIVKEYAEIHAGSVSVSSTVGVGSTFKVSLPILTEDDIPMLRILEVMHVARNSAMDMSVILARPQPEIRDGAVLTAMGEEIYRTRFRQTDRMVVRPDHGDILFILLGASKEAIPVVLAKMRAALGPVCDASCVGQASYPDDAGTAEDLLRAVEKSANSDTEGGSHE